MTEKRIQAIRGMNDVLPGVTPAWQYLEAVFVTCMHQYAYQEIRFPMMESTQLFKRSIGEVTDIVEKEMYTFNDVNDQSVSLRPEGTAGCLRACLEHGLLHHQQQKLWYAGPMFRRERPQQGRYRQFQQFGVEALGISGLAIELELIQICYHLWSKLSINEHVTLQINTIGDLSERQAYRQLLIDYFSPKESLLDEDSKQRLHRSPLRLLDSKHPAMAELVAQAPKLYDVLGEQSRLHFEGLCQGLDDLGIAYNINPKLVRGLDYYGHFVFEWVSDQLGAQATICAGGRYDKLVEHLGGQPTPAVGFAMGVERLLMLMEKLGFAINKETAPDVFFVAENQKTQIHALKLAEVLRQTCQIAVQVYLGDAGFKSQFKQADKSGARLALVLGEQELLNGSVGIKDLRERSPQVMIFQDKLQAYIQTYFSGEQGVDLHDRNGAN